MAIAEGKPESRKATNEPRTHLLIKLGDSLPLPVDAEVVRENLSYIPNDKTRPGEQHTFAPISNTDQTLTVSEKMVIASGR